MTDTQKTTIDDVEVERFSKMAAQWWNPTGKFRPLHKFNPVRLNYIRSKATEHFAIAADNNKPFEGLRLLDIGCGGGLLCEPMARMGAHVTGADASETNIEVAKIHAQQSGLTIDYRADTSENLAANGETFDIILNMEVVEHVADVELFLTSCAQMLKPGGLMFIATINRTFKARALAIFGAEYVLRWLPKGTHQYEKLVRPEEISTPLTKNGLSFFDQSGVFYNPIQDSWNLSPDIDVNYMMVFERKR